MGSTKPQVIADNQNPALTGLRKQAAHGWWEQWVAANNLIDSEGVVPGTVTFNPNGTVTLGVTTLNGVAETRTMTILEGFKGGKIELSARFRIAGVAAGETANLVLVALGQPLGAAGFTEVELADAIATVVIDDTLPTTVQEISGVFETSLADGDNLEIGLFLQKTLGAVGAINVEFAGLQIAQIMQQSIPRGGNR